MSSPASWGPNALETPTAAAAARQAIAQRSTSNREPSSERELKKRFTGGLLIRRPGRKSAHPALDAASESRDGEAGALPPGMRATARTSSPLVADRGRSAVDRAGPPGDTPSVPTLREWLAEAPFTLGLSSGFFGFFAHTGVVSVLEAEGLRPARVVGSSAGALVGGLWAAGTPAARLREELLALRREHFWDPWPGLGLLRGRMFRARLDGMLPVRTFEQCATPLAVSAFDVLGLRTAVLDAGPLAPAIHASCAAPLLFQPVRIGARLYSDGGVLDRHGLAGAGSGEPDPLPPPDLALAVAARVEPGAPGPRATRAAGGRAPGLPRLGPFRLERAGEAIERAADGMRAALDAPA